MLLITIFSSYLLDHMSAVCYQFHDSSGTKFHPSFCQIPVAIFALVLLANRHTFLDLGYYIFVLSKIQHQANLILKYHRNTLLHFQLSIQIGHLVWPFLLPSVLEACIKNNRKLNNLNDSQVFSCTHLFCPTPAEHGH